MATKLHKDLTGADRHPNAIDGAIGSELSPASQATDDARWLERADDTSAPPADTVANTAPETNFARSRIAANALPPAGRCA